ncbi:MAG: methyl-accepting chemotaxis protein [Desulfobacteraceae bacterium]
MDFKDKKENDTAKSYRRKKYFFEESSQGKYLFSYFILACLVMLLFTLLFVYFSTDSLSIIYDNNQLKIGKTPDIMLDSILSIHGILIVVCGFSILYFVTRFTHKTVGPLFKIGRTIDNMANGDLTSRIYLRKNDECKELADKINYFNSIVYKKFKEIENLSNDLDRCLQEFPPSEHEKNSDAFHVSVRNINSQIRNSLSFFNLSGDLPEE